MDHLFLITFGGNLNSQEECMMRVKYISDMVKKKKQMEEERQRAEQEQQQRPVGDAESVSSESSRSERNQSIAT